MKDMMKALIFLLIIVCPSTINAQDSFISIADGEFDKLVLLLNEQERNDWKSKSFDATMGLSKKIEAMKAVDRYLKSQGDYEKIKYTRAFSFLREFNYVKLEAKTNLVEDLGRLLYQRKIDQEM